MEEPLERKDRPNVRRIQVVTWNTYMAPLMPDRVDRRQDLHRALLRWDAEQVDLVLLQEMHNFSAGPISYLIYRLLLIICGIPSWLQRWMDLLMILEGYLCPLFEVNLRNPTIDFVRSQTRFTTMIQGSRKWGLGLDSGLMILSRHPVYSMTTQEYVFPLDIIHYPGYLTAKFQIHDEMWHVVNAHLLPLHDNSNFMYRVANVINQFLFWRPSFAMQKDQISALLALLEERQCAPTIFGGDFNLERHSYCWNALAAGLQWPIQVPHYFETTHGFPRPGKELDYLWFNPLVWRHYTIGPPQLEVALSSDHFPVRVELQPKPSGGGG